MFKRILTTQLCGHVWATPRQLAASPRRDRDLAARGGAAPARPSATGGPPPRGKRAAACKTIPLQSLRFKRHRSRPETLGSVLDVSLPNGRGLEGLVAPGKEGCLVTSLPGRAFHFFFLPKNAQIFIPIELCFLPEIPCVETTWIQGCVNRSHRHMTTHLFF